MFSFINRKPKSTNGVNHSNTKKCLLATTVKLMTGKDLTFALIHEPVIQLDR